jgi:hypothetical protein
MPGGTPNFTNAYLTEEVGKKYLCVQGQTPEDTPLAVGTNVTAVLDSGDVLNYYDDTQFLGDWTVKIKLASEKIDEDDNIRLVGTVVRKKKGACACPQPENIVWSQAIDVTEGPKA